MLDGRREPTDFFIKFCECLNRFDVRYGVVGSEAVAFHGAPRYSADFDTFVLPTRANLFRVVAALEVFGLAELAEAIDAEVWAKTLRTLRLGEAPTQVDVLLQLSGVDFPQSKPRRSTDSTALSPCVSSDSTLFWRTSVQPADRKTSRISRR